MVVVIPHPSPLPLFTQGEKGNLSFRRPIMQMGVAGLVLLILFLRPIRLQRCLVHWGL